MIDRLRSLQSLLVLVYAAVLPVSLTGTWAVLIAGLIVSGLLLFSDTTGGESVFDRVLKSLKQPPLALPILAFAVAVIVSGCVNGGLIEGLNSLCTLRALLVYFWAFHAFKDSTLLSRATGWLLAVSSVAGLWGAIQQVSGFHPFGYKYLQGTGFFGGPMAFAGQMQLFSLLALALFLKKSYCELPRPFCRTPVFLVILVANFLGLFFASERSAWLGFIAGVTVACAICSWRTAVRACAALAAMAVVAWFTVPVMQQRILPLLDWQKDVSVRVRLFLWHQAALIFKQSPLFGVGIRRFPRFDIPEAIVPGHSTDLNHAHSNYFQILATTGIIGLIVYMWLLICALRVGLAQYRLSGGFASAAALGVLSGTIALMVAGVFEYNFGTAQVRLAQWFLLAMLCGASTAPVMQTGMCAQSEPVMELAKGD